MSRGLASSFSPPTLGDDMKVAAAASRNPQDIVERALEGDPTTPSSSSSPVASRSSTLADPLFPSASSSASPVFNRRPISQTVLMWVFAVIALGLLILMVIWRYALMRFRNRRSVLQRHQGRTRTGGATGLAPSQSGRIVRDSDFVNSWDRETRPIALSPSFFRTDIMPVVDQRGVQINGPRRGRRERVRALDVDAGGRRGGGDDSYNGHGTQDDELPAYEAGKGPPGYHVVTLELSPPSSQNIPQAHLSPISRDGATRIPQTSAPDSPADPRVRSPSISAPSSDYSPS